MHRKGKDTNQTYTVISYRKGGKTGLEEIYQVGL